MNAVANASVSAEAVDLVHYLDRRDWTILPGMEEKAFRCLLRGASFITLLDVATYAKQNSKPLSPAVLYKAWLDEAGAGSLHAYAAWFNLGIELSASGDTVSAATAYRNALTLRPDQHGAAVNLGLLHENMSQTDKALEIWQQAIQPDDVRTALLNQRGRLLERLGRFDEAERDLYRSLLTNPRQHDAFTHWLHLRMKMCQWPVYGAPIPGLTHEDMVAGTSGLSILALHDSNDLANRWVENWLQRRMPAVPVRLCPERGYDHGKVRIGYLSSDYNLHPVSMLMAELLERHDRSRFEVYGYCSSKDDGSDLRRRVLGAFDKCTRIVDLTDEQAARAIRQDEIDILIDLNGLTDSSRLGVLRWRPAPVQMTYLGFVGSLPVPELDYAIVDEFVVPPSLAHNFHPAPLYMPRCYQVNDTKSVIGPPETREAVGLPEDKFIYCSFSNTYKISEEMFDAWMSILASVENSVLWVLARSPWAQQNMTARAAQRGIAAERLIFADPVPPAQYYARLALADVFLDTFPYNSGTTASDALRMGLPLITLTGNTFSSRMAGSLLHAMDLDRGIARSRDEYVALGIRLGTDREEYRAFRDALSGDLWRRTIGNIEMFVPEFEERLLSVMAARERSPALPAEQCAQG